MIRSVLSWLVTICIVISISSTIHTKDNRKINIGFVIDGPWENNAYILSLFQEEINSLLSGEFECDFRSDQVHTGDWTIESIDQLLESHLTDKNIDIVIGLGAIASHLLATRDTIGKPVIAPFVIDCNLQNIPKSDNRSGVSNLSYITTPWSFERDLKTFKEIFPFKKMALLFSQPMFAAIPELESNITLLKENMGIYAVGIPVEFSAKDALDKLDESFDAVYVGAMVHMPSNEYDLLIEGINKKKLPSFALMGASEVHRGLFASISTDSYFNKIARRTALNIQRILLGEKASDLPVSLNKETKLTINMKTAREIEKSPSWELLTEAELINQKRKEGKHYNLRTAVQEALQNNKDIIAFRESLIGQSLEVRKSKGSVLPQIDAALTGVLIDKDRAESSFGAQAEKTLTGKISASQVLFNDPAFSAIGIQKSLYKSEQEAFTQLRFDVVENAATAYLQVLRSNTIELVQKDNLSQTRANLEQARSREELGISGPAEVLRWESQLANNRINLINANANRNKAEIQFNRILGKNLEDPFITEDLDISMDGLLSSNERFFRLIDSPTSFKLFRSFLAEEAVRNSPEIARINELISAQKRLHSFTSRKKWLPTIGLIGSLEKEIDKGGAGTSSSLGSLFPSSASLPESDDVSWSVAIQMSLPLFRGGNLRTETKIESQELLYLKRQHESLVEKIRQQARSSAHDLGASYAAIRLSNDAAETAESSLELVVDAYARGAVKLIDVLDAQNNALVANLAASDAVYSFLIRLMETERSIGQFYLLLDVKEQNAFFERAENYFIKHKDE